MGVSLLRAAQSLLTGRTIREVCILEQAPMPIPSTVLLEAGLVPKPYVVLFVDSIFNRLLNEGFVQCRGWLMGIHLCLTFLNRMDEYPYQ